MVVLKAFSLCRGDEQDDQGADRDKCDPAGRVDVVGKVSLCEKWSSSTRFAQRAELFDGLTTSGQADVGV